MTAVVPFNDGERKHEEQQLPPPKLAQLAANQDVGGLAAQSGDRKTRERFAWLLLAVLLALAVVGEAVSRAQGLPDYNTFIVMTPGPLIGFLQWAVLLPPGCSPWPLQCWCCGRRQFFCHT